MNHFSMSFPPSSDTLWSTPLEHHHHPKSYPLFNPLPNFPQNDDVSDNSSSDNIQNYDSPSQTTSSDPREHMFEKPLTPSDVGKLNRLVIPKQHAEKYFPLSAFSAVSDGGSEGAAVHGGALLDFQDETGKCWRFRYSYWNSSQSYVLTKGWSRYVKEKKLDAGDVVLFDRHRFELDRFFIGWRRRGSAAPSLPAVRPVGEEFGSGGCTDGRQYSSFYNAVQVHQGYSAPQPQRIAAAFQFQSADGFNAVATENSQHNQKAERSSGRGNLKRLRLFGVNLDCQLKEDIDAEPQISNGSCLSSHGPVHGSASGLGSGSGSHSDSGAIPTGYAYFDYVGYPLDYHCNYQDISFSQNVNQMNNRLG